MASQTQPSKGRLNSDFLPKRVLDLHQGHGTDEIRLVETCTISADKRGPYVTLSHRWGSTQSLITTKETYAAFCKRISFQSLPATFSDAVEVCRHMQVRYLWIDALCIIQDDVDDWKTQAVHMGDYYRQSYFTIATHTASSDSAGFLQSVLDLHSVRRGPHDLVTLESDFFSEVDCSALNHRGWVLQERLLSPRILHFTQYHLYCEDLRGYLADDDRAAETLFNLNENLHKHGHNYQLPVKTLPVDEAVAVRETTILQLPDMEQNEPSYLANIWAMAIERYSGCDLTHRTDKLPAVAGMAKYIHPWINGAHYYAGIWSSHLSQGLLWAPTDSNLTCANDGRAPSWSWASTDGQIQFLKANIRSKLTLEAEFVRVDALDSSLEMHWINGAARLILCTALKRVEQFGWERNSINSSSLPGRLVGQVNCSSSSELFRREPFMRKVYWAKTDDRWRAAHAGWIVPDEDEERTPFSRFWKDGTYNIFCAMLAAVAESDEVLVLFLASVDQPSATYRRLGMGGIRRTWFQDATVQQIVII
ncbi:hypothetical protein BBP40_004103 [Aspergillus hancockii]|nr:hypothetical protein BBP40_004103 [Aspergillus hancockii]